MRVNVLWDRWDDVPHEERTEIILKAYENAEGKDVRERLAWRSA